jgi:hypothetical protein
MPPNYENSKIYRIFSPSLNLCYYGSTTQSLEARLAKHIMDYYCYNKDKNKYSYYSSFKVLECGDYKIELIEDVKCTNKRELERIEGRYQKDNDCVNMLISGRTRAEYRNDNRAIIREKNKAYKQLNKDKIRVQNKLYNETHREQIYARKKAYYNANRDYINEKRRELYLKKQNKAEEVK